MDRTNEHAELGGSKIYLRCRVWRSNLHIGISKETKTIGIELTLHIRARQRLDASN